MPVERVRSAPWQPPKGKAPGFFDAAVSKYVYGRSAEQGKGAVRGKQVADELRKWKLPENQVVYYMNNYFWGQNGRPQPGAHLKAPPQGAEARNSSLFMRKWTQEEA